MYDIDSAAAELGLSPGELAEIADAFCIELTEMLAAIEASVSQADYVTLAQLCHSLKGTAANLRVNEISTIAETLECQAKRQELDGVTALLPALRREAAQFKAIIQDMPNS